MRQPTARKTAPAYPRIPRVALIIETSLAPGRDILRGISRYVRENGPWSTFVEPRSLEQAVPGWLRNWQGDGIIARIQNRKIAEIVRASGIPTVDVLGVVESGDMPLVHTDDTRIASLAAEHLLNRGFKRFGFFGLAGENWAVRRRDAFVAATSIAGCPCALYETPRRIQHTRMWEDNADDLARWVQSLVRPVGVMLCSDQCGPVMLEACRRAGAAVPDEVAVLGVDNDEPLCDATDPALSSVWPDHVRVGYESAGILDRLMHGEGTTRRVYVPPKGVVTRRSTDVLALEDREISEALRFIREHACEGLGIDRVAEHVALSRSVLQRQFKKLVGRTLHEEMVRVRLRRAQDLLRGTELPLRTVAAKSGFRHQEYMGAVFRDRLGQTPHQFRHGSR